MVVYNFTLSFLSGVLFYFLSRELWSVSTSANGSWFQTFCDPDGKMARAQGAIYACYFLNYVFKYVELTDTVLLCLRKKQTPSVQQRKAAQRSQAATTKRQADLRSALTRTGLSVAFVAAVRVCVRFIHIYHHAITVLLCWTQLTVGTCLQWVSRRSGRGNEDRSLRRATPLPVLPVPPHVLSHCCLLCFPLSVCECR